MALIGKLMVVFGKKTYSSAQFAKEELLRTYLKTFVPTAIILKQGEVKWRQ